jgi:hypothetical protein
MPYVNIKGDLNETEYKKLKELSKKEGSKIAVLRLLLNKNFETIDKESLEKEINGLKNDFSELKKHLESIDERLSVLINILSYEK